ncbi:hypothetical protein NDR87_27650 [Nocardia sp. CDC159]|uniref:Uncharacterized protein n=1 Tax=Nocardia pulmonis TaxID=2951408 RepID=A0A9X2EAD5_9NOCA|nr:MULTISPECIES: hypothetical protein [Nocardia]MCM6777267.1 hypothetical protein [Nocardia pulmonis]MCM6790152.1 hypothetical protein [Nocardia sp. CDC159]
MSDKLANTKAFYDEVRTVLAGKLRWESYPGSALSQELRHQFQLLQFAIDADVRGDATGTPTDVNTKKFAADLYKAGPVVERYTEAMTPTQRMLFGDRQSSPYANRGFAGDLVAALQKDDPTWKP